MAPSGAPSGYGGFVPLEKLLMIKPDLVFLKDPPQQPDPLPAWARQWVGERKPASRYGPFFTRSFMFVVRPDGSGRTEIHPPELPLPPGGMPDWVR